MQTSAFRVEVIRFSLLVTLTVAMLSVAIRLASHSDSHPGGQAGPRASGQPSATAGGPTMSPLTTTPTATTPTTPTVTTTPAVGGTTGGAGANGGPAAQPVLPVTGDDAAIKLVALSMVLIGGGALTVRSSRR